MRGYSDEAYVLRTRELGDTDLIVTLFAAGNGQVRGVARSARSSRRRFGGCLEPLTRVRLGWTERDGRELHRIDSMEALQSHAAMQADPLLQAACAVLCELGEQFSHPHQADPVGYRLLGAVLEALSNGADPLQIVRYAQYWTLRIHGLEPGLDCCADCGGSTESGAWVSRDGDLCCRRCGSQAEALRLSRAEREFLLHAGGMPPSQIAATALGEGGRAIDRMLRAQLERFCERSLRTLRHLRAASRAAS